MITKIETRQDGAGNDVVEQKYNHLAPAEMMKEDNYNKIDGIIDTKPKSFNERMENAKKKAKEHNSRKVERHKKSRHSNKSERHKKERHSEKS